MQETKENKRTNILIDFLKGFAIGLIVTVPGFSIGTLAIIIHIYERLIDDLSDIIHHPLSIIKKDFFLGIGFIIGFIIDVIAISYLLDHFPMQTVCLFVGLVISSIPTIYSNGINAKLEKLNQTNNTKQSLQKLPFNKLWGEGLTFLICIVLLVFVTLLNGSTTHEISLSFTYILAMFLCGIISAGFMIIPGISGSLIVLALGYYDCIIKSLKGFGSCILNWDFINFSAYFVSLIVFLIGVCIGLVLVSKLLQKLFEKAASYVYFGILGLIVGSPFAIIYLTNHNYVVNWQSPWVYIVSVITIAIGLVLGLYSNKLENKNDTKQENDAIKEEK